MTANQSPIEGKLLSAVQGGNYPGSIKGENGNTYSYGKIQGGLQPHTGPVTIDGIPIIAACSAYPGGALVLVVNAEDKTDSLVDFYAAPGPKGPGFPPALNNLGGNCPDVFQVSLHLAHAQSSSAWQQLCRHSLEHACRWVFACLAVICLFFVVH